MPEQQGRRGQAVTGAPFEAPFETPVVRLGQKGINLRLAQDARDPRDLLRMTNAYHQGEGGLTGRPGLTAFATAGTEHHSVIRIDTINGIFYRLWGIDTDLAYGTSGALAAIEGGFSGAPLTFASARSPLVGDSWVVVADYNKLRKVRITDGLDLPLGVVPPSLPAGVVVEAPAQTLIDDFESTAGWIGNAGRDVSVPTGFPSGIPTTQLIPGALGGVNAVLFLSNVGSAVLGYWNFWGKALTLDLSSVGGLPASDDDLFHLWIHVSHPDRITELRVYFVVSDTFSPSVLPGVDDFGANADAYVKAFRQNDFSAFISARTSQVEAAEIARVRDIRDRALKTRKIDDPRDSWATQRAERDPARAVSIQAGAAAQQWVEFGRIGVPIRRGDFQRIGASSGRDWATVTGLIVFVQTNVADGVGIGLDDFYFFGGSGPDTSEPGAQQYDYRYTHVDPRTGSEGNPSPEMDRGTFVDALRSPITVSPAAFGDGAMRQRIYRRGGSLIDDWYFCGETTGDGAAFTDTASDAEIAAAGTVEIDNDQPVSSVDAAGNTIQAQPVPVIFGPVEGMLIGLWDPNRLGDIYWSKPDQLDSWPAANHLQVCPPSEYLQNGGLFGGQAFVFSTQRLYYLYPNLTGVSAINSAPTACKKGLVTRWGMAVGYGAIWFVADDGIYRTTGGEPELLSLDLDPLFRGVAVEGYQPFDFFNDVACRLELFEHQLWFFAADITGARQTWVYSLLTESWRHYTFATPIGMAYADAGNTTPTLILGGTTSGTSYTHEGTSDDGATIPVTIRTGAIDFGRPREDKLFGDVIVDAVTGGLEITVQTFVNTFETPNPAQVIASGAARERFILDPFGVSPQKARTIGAEITWTTTLDPPTVFQIGASITPQPDYTVNRVTNWDDLGHPSEKYLTGCILECDTGNQVRTILVEYDLDGQRLVAATLSVQTNGRHKRFFSWPAVKANLVRIRPEGDCIGWLLYRLDWLFDPEPPRIALWDINHENGWDQYYTGLDLECDTFGVVKFVDVYVDGVRIVTGWPVQAAGRRVVHLTFGPGRGHIFRFVATDDAPGLLYTHRWHLQEEPSEQTNWNQNFTIAGTLGDKYLKGVILECDTFDRVKAVQVQIDGAVVETLAVRANDRTSLQFSFAQHLGRVFRLLPVDLNPGRLYSMQWVFDQEPFQFAYWETQETDHGIGRWQVPTYAHVTVRSTFPVTLSLTTFNQKGASTTDLYEIPATGNVKQKRFVPFKARKGVLFKYVLTSDAPFFLYEEETEVCIQPWGEASTRVVHPFGNDDQDPTRSMVNAVTAAMRTGGSA